MRTDEGKIFNDPIHGTIQLHPFLVKIIDTPEFQRLRHIKQMGGTYYVYPEAQHNRFEHSIGTAHLAGKLVRHLQKLQPELYIDDKDVLCVEIAGLCHDLGHGPFSHMFDGMFMKGKETSSESEWEHEQGSCDMFDRIMKNMQKHVDKKYNKDAKKCQPIKCDEKVKLEWKDFTFIKEMINGPSSQNRRWAYEGRQKVKSFLYEIISNKTSGVDVDKWDYFARDCHHLGIKTGFDHDRFIKCMRVIKVTEADGQWRNRICVRDKEVFNLYEMFHMRFALHKRACHHPAVNAVEHMICHALNAADEYLKIPGDDNKTFKISKCVENVSSFCNLDDRILLTIQISGMDELKDSRKILERLATRHLYKCVGNEILGREACKLEDDVGLVDQIRSQIEGQITRLKGQLRVSVVKFNYGSGDKDPIEKYRFYKKGKKTEAIEIPKEEVSLLLPDVFEEKVVQVFCVSQDKKVITAAEKAFKRWYKKPEPSTNQLLRKFLERTETLKGMDAEAKEMIREIRDSLDKKDELNTATKRKAASPALAGSSKLRR